MFQTCRVVFLGFSLLGARHSHTFVKCMKLPATEDSPLSLFVLTAHDWGVVYVSVWAWPFASEKKHGGRALLAVTLSVACVVTSQRWACWVQFKAVNLTFAVVLKTKLGGSAAPLSFRWHHLACLLGWDGTCVFTGRLMRETRVVPYFQNNEMKWEIVLRLLA